ncbi:Superoxide dismutase, copper/zinc binding domain containing protein [Tylopilus felleus]
MDFYKDRKSNKPIYITAVVTAAVLFVLYQLFFRGPEIEHVQKAVVVLKGNSPVTGKVTFEQSTRDGPVTISGTIRNLDPSSLRGFHVHALGDLTEGCLSTGSHFNPFNKPHGARTDSVRHVGDLGNIASDEHGTATFSFTDDVISLNGPKSIIGRAVVVHAGQDDLGKGGNSESLKTGNAGGRAACGAIGKLYAILQTTRVRAIFVTGRA